MKCACNNHSTTCDPDTGKCKVWNSYTSLLYIFASTFLVHLWRYIYIFVDRTALTIQLVSSAKLVNLVTMAMLRAGRHKIARNATVHWLRKQIRKLLNFGSIISFCTSVHKDEQKDRTKTVFPDQLCPARPCFFSISQISMYPISDLASVAIWILMENRPVPGVAKDTLDETVNCKLWL